MKRSNLAIIMIVSVLSGCGLFQASAPAPLRVSVSSGAHPGRLEVRPGFTVSWEQNTFSGAGRVLASEIVSPGPLPNWFSPDGRPVEISVDGPHDALDLTWRPPHRPPTSGLVPAVLHWASAEKRWTVAASGPAGGAATGTSATFSPHWPGWADPKKFADGVTQLVHTALGKRTDAPGCSGGPSWATLSPPAVDVVLTCLTTSHSADGTERAQVQLRNNRGYVLEVPVPAGAVSSAVDGQPELIRAAARAFTGRDSALLSPGQLMTLEFDRPSVGAPVRIDAAPTVVAIAAQLTSDLIGEFGGPAAVFRALADCKLAPNIPFTIQPDVHSVGDVLRGVVSCFASLFANRKAATLLAQEVVSALEKVDVASAGVDPVLKGKVAALAGKIRLLAVGIKVIDVSSDLMDYIADNWTNHRTGDYTGMSAQLSLKGLLVATRVINVRPVDSTAHLLAGYSVTDVFTGSCSDYGVTNSSTLFAGAYRCFASQAVFDPCWSYAEGSQLAVVCMVAPWDQTVAEIRLSDPVSATGSGTGDAAPWAVQLASGERCTGFSGSHDSIGDRVVDYFCGNDLVLLRGANRTNPIWAFDTATYANGTYTIGRPVPIKTAWMGLPSR